MSSAERPKLQHTLAVGANSTRRRQQVACDGNGAESFAQVLDALVLIQHNLSCRSEWRRCCTWRARNSSAAQRPSSAAEPNTDLLLLLLNSIACELNGPAQRLLSFGINTQIVSQAHTTARTQHAAGRNQFCGCYYSCRHKMEASNAHLAFLSARGGRVQANSATAPQSPCHR